MIQTKHFTCQEPLSVISGEGANFLVDSWRDFHYMIIQMQRGEKMEITGFGDKWDLSEFTGITLDSCLRGAENKDYNIQIKQRDLIYNIERVA